MNRLNPKINSLNWHSKGQPNAWLQGYDYGQRNNEYNNPYGVFDTRRAQWKAGWLAAQDDNVKRIAGMDS